MKFFNERRFADARLADDQHELLGDEEAGDLADAGKPELVAHWPSPARF
jgi:hypothetical protein